MMGLPDGRKSFKIHSVVLTQYRSVTDRQTDRQTRCRSKDRTTLCVAQIILLRTIWNCKYIHVQVNPEFTCRMMDIGPQTYGLFSVDCMRNIGIHFIEIVIHSRSDTTSCLYALYPVVGGYDKKCLTQTLLLFFLRFVKFPP